MRLKDKRLLKSKQKIISTGKGTPSNKEGRDGDLTVRNIPGRGLFLYYKYHSKWYSTRLSKFKPKAPEGKEPVILPKGKTPVRIGEMVLDTDNNIKIAKNIGTGGKVSRRQVLSIDSNNVVDSSIIKTERSDESPTGGDFIVRNKTGSAFIQLITQVTAGDVWINFIGAYDGANLKQWCIGMDNSATGDPLVIHKSSSGAALLTPSDVATPSLLLTSAGALTLGSIVNGTGNFVTETSGLLKKRTAAQVLSDIGGGAITALNNATANELVTVGATTTELDAEANLLFDGDHLSITATGKIVFDGDGGHTYIVEGATDRLDFYVGGTLLLQIQEAVVDAVHINCSLSIDAASKLIFDSSILGHTYITESSDDVLDFYVGTDKMLSLDEANNKITLAAESHVAAIADGTEFSATNSAYAGMILGYTCVGADVADDAYILTTSYVCFADSGSTAISVSFITPPSEKVEIEAELYFSAGSSNKQLRLSLSDNATYGSNTLSHTDQFEKIVSTPARGNGGTFTQKWFIGDGNLAAIGSSNSIYIAASTDSTTGTPTIKWGGDASNEYTNLVMKAVALPKTIVVGS